MKHLLKDIVSKSQGFVELRYHKRTSNSFMAQRGRVEVAHHSIGQGVGVRALVDGAWGFAATADISRSGIERAIAGAQASGRALAEARGKKNLVLARGRLATMDFSGPGYAELNAMSLGDK